jgi:IS30 family transposase
MSYHQLSADERIELCKLRVNQALSLLEIAKRMKRSQSTVMVTHVDKASKFLLAELGKNKTAGEINRVTLELFSKIQPAYRKTMTFDNGTEFI